MCVAMLMIFSRRQGDSSNLCGVGGSSNQILSREYVAMPSRAAKDEKKTQVGVIRQRIGQSMVVLLASCQTT